MPPSRPSSKKHDETISRRTLAAMDRAMENLNRGIVGPPLDPEELRRLLISLGEDPPVVPEEERENPEKG